ncbi:MAG: phage minor capsid protein [Lachnospiraceae bacterium]
MTVNEYDIAKAFEAIEKELMSSMLRNMERHKAEETREGIEWSQWQAEQLKALEQYKIRNREKYGTQFKDINKEIAAIISAARISGEMEQEMEILRAIKRGFTRCKKTRNAMTAQFFRMNDRKIEALIRATVHDMEKAETAILRMANDKYRQIIFNAQVYANTGAGTYEKAVDMAAKDMLSSGLGCVEYANGARHTLKEYADMAIRTASKRAYLTGEGEKRKEWGISTVIINKRGNPCPLCLPWVGKVMIDDVWSGGKKSDGPYPLMSTAVSSGLYHPRCRDSHTTYFEGISLPPDNKFTKKEIQDIEQENKKEAQQQYARRQAEKYERLAENSLDKSNQKKYGRKANEWKYNVIDPAKSNVYEDVTQKWILNDINIQGSLTELQSYEVKGVRYNIDGINVKQNNSKRELEVADILRKTLGVDVYLVPEVNGKYNNVSTPDYIINDGRWDLKELNQGTSKELLRNIVHKKKEQAENFIFDISECKLDIEEINRQAGCIFDTYYNTKHVNTIMLIKGNEIVKILKKK